MPGLCGSSADGAVTMELFQKTAAQLSQMLQNKECSAVELLSSVQKCIRQKEPEIGAYLTFSEESMQQALAVDTARAKQEQLHPLAGIPIAVKDNISTKGLRTTCASRMLAQYTPPFDATVIRRLREAGAVILGKTNMDEFAMGSSTENSCFHPTRNPLDPARTPGGSSGGSAAAVAAGEAVLALGSDTGGSVRQPAAFCGVIGMKPTYGSVSRYGLIAYASSFDQIGTFSRSVTDAAMLCSLICGHDPRDATSARVSHPDFAAQLQPDVRGLRIGIPKELLDDGIADGVRTAVISALHELEHMGAVLCEVTLPSAEYAVSAYYILACAEASSNLARFDGVRYGFRAENCRDLTELYERSRSEGFGAEVKRRILLGTFVLSEGYYEVYYQKAKAAQQRIAGEMQQILQHCDMIAAPSALETAFLLGAYSDSRTAQYQADRCTVPANLAGLPAISIPCGIAEHGMPAGLQLIGRQFSEQRLLNAAYAYEMHCGGSLLQKGVSA